jgi:trehalose-phosphatase
MLESKGMRRAVRFVVAWLSPSGSWPGWGRTAPLLGRRLSPFKGVRIENKTFSVAVHYRRSREKKKARAAILEAAAALGPIRVIGGKQVVNILPEGAPHKGIALERERHRLRRDTAIYVGDDETDEDVFGLDQPVVSWLFAWAPSAPLKPRTM